MPSSDEDDQATTGWRQLFSQADLLPMTATAEAKRRRGRTFEKILHGMLAEADLEPRASFRPGGEEIDGSFVYSGRVMLLEAKWTQGPLPASSIYQFRGKVDGKLVGTIGIFISMGGFGPDAIDALVAGKVINTILFDGDDMRAIAANQIGIRVALDLKLRAAAETGAPFLPLWDPTTRKPVESAIWEPKSAGTKVVVVEGRFDALLVHALADELGPSAYEIEVVPAGGVFNLPPIANLARAAGDGSVVVIADGDGDPEAVRNTIESGLGGRVSREVSRRPVVLVLDPTFEAAIGLPEGTRTEWRRAAKRDREGLRQAIHRANVRHLAQENPAVKRLLDELGFADGD